MAIAAKRKPKRRAKPDPVKAWVKRLERTRPVGQLVRTIDREMQ